MIPPRPAVALIQSRQRYPARAWPAPSREMQLSPERLIEQWARIQMRVDGDGLGHARSSPIYRAMKGQLTAGGDYGSSLPRGVQIPGLSGYIAVERTLCRLRPLYRQTLEAVHVMPTTEVGRNHQQIAKHLGITFSSLAARLHRFKQHLRADVEGR